MGKMYLYYPDGSKIEDVKEFIKFYSKAYYLFVTKKQEDVIERLLQKEEDFNDVDILEFMNWKFGREPLTDAQKKEMVIVHRGTGINKKFLDKVLAIQDRGKIYDDNINDEYRELVDADGIGSIYALAVIYILTREEYPIYDRFVRNAKEAIINNKKPGEKIHLSELSVAKVPKQYWEYKTFFEGFKEFENNNRVIDRALWTYGRLFG
ncbi:hypothetical protein [Pseudobutyrivibrio ruminis]|uniref:Uncharacterized protein n=1 Tax=Pseudobutyrivibrio ruminis TaxID=46206 RepID=A0A2G3DU36_9FIRM|nr:hypothetical protein [Pseudobutyrivibrio ruminis]PHU34403.1 hypothetical protein CSX01_10095 [Pseudobutyrivibrio ruminis]